MLRSGSIVAQDDHIHAAVEHVPVMPGLLAVPFSRAWLLLQHSSIRRTDET
jgi:hypothetical protein